MFSHAPVGSNFNLNFSSMLNPTGLRESGLEEVCKCSNSPEHKTMARCA